MSLGGSTLGSPYGLGEMGSVRGAVGCGCVIHVKWAVLVWHPFLKGKSIALQCWRLPGAGMPHRASAQRASEGFVSEGS